MKIAKKKQQHIILINRFCEQIQNTNFIGGQFQQAHHKNSNSRFGLPERTVYVRINDE
jgi:hypothetical protein